VIRYRCSGCGFTLAVVYVREVKGKYRYDITVQLYDGRVFRGGFGALTPQELAAMIERCPHCGKPLSARPTRIDVKPANR
jgi:C4-type Zn-finger protein